MSQPFPFIRINSPNRPLHFPPGGCVGVEEKGSENIWIALMGPDTPALGELSNTAAVTQSQIAATVAAFLGKDFHQAMPDAAPPLPGVIVACATLYADNSVGMSEGWRMRVRRKGPKRGCMAATVQRT